MKIIPKPLKNKYIYRSLKKSDLLVVILGFAMAGIAYASNFFGESKVGSIVLACVVGLITSVMCIRIGGESIYTLIAKSVLHMFKPQIYTNKAIDDFITIKDIESNGDIKYKNGKVGRMIEIDGTSFYTLSAMQQEILVDALADTIRNVTDDIAMQLYKCDRPIEFVDVIADYERKIDVISKYQGMSEEERKPRLEVLRSQLEKLKVMQNEEKRYFPHYYLIIQANTQGNLDYCVNNSINTLQTQGINIFSCNRKIVSIVYKYMYCYNCDENSYNELSYLEWLKPTYLRFKPNYTIIDDKKIHTVAVNAYPRVANNAWGDVLFNKYGNNILMNMTPVSTDKAKKQMNALYASLIGGRTKKLEDRQMNAEHISAIENTMKKINDLNECLVSTSLSVQYTVKDFRDVKAKLRSVRRMGLTAQKCAFDQAKAYKARGINTDKLPKYQLTGEVVGAMYPMTRRTILQRNGILLGEMNRVPVVLNMNIRDSYHFNSNMFVTGMVGSGKSFNIKTLLTNLASEGEKIFILDPSPEYDVMAHRLGGQIIDLSSGIFKINPFHVFVSQDKGVFSAHLGLLSEFFNTIFKNMDDEARLYLDKAVVDMYADFNIGDKTDFAKLKATQYPTFGDLYSYVKNRLKTDGKDNMYIQGLINKCLLSLDKCIRGRYATLWNGYSAINITSSFVVFDLHALLNNDEILVATAQMQLIAGYLNAELMRNYNLSRVRQGDVLTIEDGYFGINIVADEVHRLLSPDSTIIVKKLKEWAKQCRKYGGKLISITQSCVDFLATPEIEFLSKSLMTEVQYSMFFKAAPTHLTDIDRIFKEMHLTETERKQLVSAPKGSALFSSGNIQRCNMQIIANDVIRDIFERDIV